MTADEEINILLSQYDKQVSGNASKLREFILANLPGCQKYTEMVCTIIPSKKGLKPGFYKNGDLPDPDKLLKGTAKISRYVKIRSDELLHSSSLKNLMASALTAHRQRNSAV